MLIDARESRKFTVAEAEKIARDLYGVAGSAHRLPGEFDDNFRLDSDSGSRFVLKIMHPGCDPGYVDLQIRALAHLGDLAVPRVAGRAKMFEDRIVWLLEWLPGRLLHTKPIKSKDVLCNLGRALGQVDAALSTFDHPAASRELKWDLSRAAWIADYLHHIADAARRRMISRVLMLHDNRGKGSWTEIRRGVIHGDANDHNILVDGDSITGLLDFGDMHRGAPAAELAIACVYAAGDSADPLQAMAYVVHGFHDSYPLTDAEIAALFPLILTRLAVSLTNSAYLKTIHSGDAYISVSEGQGWRTLEELFAVPEALATAIFRHACGVDPVPPARRVVDYLQASGFSPLLPSLASEDPMIFDLSAGSLLLGADPGMETAALTRLLFGKMRGAGTKLGIGRYDEARLLYTEPLFASGPRPNDERRTIHLGLDLFAEPGTPVHAPLAGTVYGLANNARRQDYGPVALLRHEPGFFTLYGHLTAGSLEHLSIDQRIEAGQQIGAIGEPPSNGDWAPHLHFQIITDLIGLDTDFPGVARASQREVFLALSPDPNLIARLPIPPAGPSKSETLASRHRHLGGNLSISYRVPLKIVRGWRQYLYDETGRAYLDVYNNVPLVGHSHPRVVEAVGRQIALLNTNTRYLHDTIVEYAGRLTALFPAPLRVCYFLNSASEANELALRLARARTGRDETIVLEHAYHGNTNTLIDISPYKFAGPGGRGRKPWIRVAPQPDPHRRDDPGAGIEYARAVADLVDGPMTFIAESLPSVGGQVVFPPGYLAGCYGAVRAAGGVCIADEVQVGFGRLGDFFWGFRMQNVVPDIVVLGKPMGNGFPLAGVVTTAEIAASFDNGMEFFSTYGGNPVACAAGLAVLDVLRDEGLPGNAARIGAYLMEQLEKLDVVDVRGRGLFLGVELESEGRASYVVNLLREQAILAGTDGPLHNVVKIRPPLIFSREDADFFADVFSKVLES